MAINFIFIYDLIREGISHEVRVLVYRHNRLVRARLVIVVIFASARHLVRVRLQWYAHPSLLQLKFLNASNQVLSGPTSALAFLIFELLDAQLHVCGRLLVGGIFLKLMMIVGPRSCRDWPD